jgi:hypothetical protein
VTEPELHAHVVAACEARGLLVYHLDIARRRSTPTSVGFPDLVITGPRGTLFRELKSEPGELTAPQRHWLEQLRAGGENAAIWRPQNIHTGEISGQLDAISRPRP